MVAIDLRMPNGQMVEYQATFRELVEESSVQHKVFERWRGAKTGRLRGRRLRDYRTDVAGSTKAYREASEAALERQGLGRQEFEDGFAALESRLGGLADADEASFSRAEASYSSSKVQSLSGDISSAPSMVGTPSSVSQAPSPGGRKAVTGSPSTSKEPSSLRQARGGGGGWVAIPEGSGFLEGPLARTAARGVARISGRVDDASPVTSRNRLKTPARIPSDRPCSLGPRSSEGADPGVQPLRSVGTTASAVRRVPPSGS
jgi:hypothetical protein